jgi:hypothetical protein
VVSSTPSLTATPASGKKRTVVVFAGANFKPSMKVTVTYESRSKDTVLCTATVGANGKFSCRGTIPRGRRGGKRGVHTIVAKQTSGTQAKTNFTLTNSRYHKSSKRS